MIECDLEYFADSCEVCSKKDTCITHFAEEAEKRELDWKETELAMDRLDRIENCQLIKKYKWEAGMPAINSSMYCNGYQGINGVKDSDICNRCFACAEEDES